MRNEEHRAGEGLDGLLELVDGGQIEMVRRLVEHEAVDPASLQQSECRSCAFAG